MKYTTHELRQGTAEWLAYRQNTLNASDAGTALGINPYKTRAELIRELATGLTKEIDAGTQRRFDDGHRFERLALPLSEAIIGEPLSPTTVSCSVPGLKRRLSASLDGATFGDTENVEHKTLSESLSAALDRGELPEQYPPQMEQGMMVTGATRCLFIASKWDTADQLIEERHVWYESNPALRAKIIAAWKQVEADVENYQHIEAAPVAVAEPVRDLPVLFVQAKGEVTSTNLPEFRVAVAEYLAGLNMTPTDDQAFADSKAIAANLRAGAKALMAKKADMLAQTATIGEVASECDLISKQMNAAALALEKKVETEETNRKGRLIQGGKNAYDDHMAKLIARVGNWFGKCPSPDFAAAIKGKSKLESMENGIATELARAKIAANNYGDLIDANLKALDAVKEHDFLFNDRAALVLKAPDDLALVIKSRISDHKEAEAKKLEAIKEAARVEAEKNAAAKVKAEADAKAKADADAKAKAEQDREAIRIVQAEVEESLTRTEPAALTTSQETRPPSRPSVAPSVAAAHTGVTGTAKLRDEIEDLLIDFDAVELIAAIQALRSIKARRDTRVAA